MEGSKYAGLGPFLFAVDLGPGQPSCPASLHQLKPKSTHSAIFGVPRRAAASVSHLESDRPRTRIPQYRYYKIRTVDCRDYLYEGAEVAEGRHVCKTVNPHLERVGYRIDKQQFKDEIWPLL